MKRYDENDRIAISNIKQYMYCKRRFCLMTLDSQWASNDKIIEGDLLHEKVNDPFFNEKRGSVQVSRSVPVYSDALNLYGIADIVEFIKDEEGISISNKKGKWRLSPLEYKNGKPEESKADNYQLCAVALCLEEMFHTSISTGDIYYGKLRRRKTIDLQEIKESVKEVIQEMQALLDENRILKKQEDQNCSSCSLIDICLPGIFEKQSGTKATIQARIKK